MNNKININNTIELDYFDEISVNDLIYAIDNANNFSLYEINSDESIENGEKNILIKIKKNK